MKSKPTLFFFPFSLLDTQVDIIMFPLPLTLSAIYTHFNTVKKKALGKHCGKKSYFTFFDNDFYGICILKSSNSHISVVICSFFEFEMMN